MPFSYIFDFVDVLARVAGALRDLRKNFLDKKIRDLSIKFQLEERHLSKLKHIKSAESHIGATSWGFRTVLCVIRGFEWHSVFLYTFELFRNVDFTRLGAGNRDGVPRRAWRSIGR